MKSTVGSHPPSDCDATPTCVRVPWLWSVGVGVVALALYVALAPPVAGDKDSAELGLVLATGGVAHPTGYPLYTALGFVFVSTMRLLGAGALWAANAWSALGGAVAITFLHRLALSLMRADPAISRRRRFLLAGLPVFLFGANPIWSYECTLAEVYSWHLAWCLGATLLATHLGRVAAGPSSVKSMGRAAVLWGVVCGLGLAHHLSSVMLSGPLTLGLFWVLVRSGRWRFRMAPAAALGLLIPLLLYIQIAWRTFHPAEVQWAPLTPTWKGFLDHVTGRAYQHLAGKWSPSAAQKQLLVLYVFPFLALSLGLSVAVAFRRGRSPGRRPMFVALAAAACLQTIFAFRYGIADPSSNFLPALALGLAALPALIGGSSGAGERTRRATSAALLLTVAVGAALVVPWTRTSIERRQGFIENDRMLHSMWDVIPGESGILFWPDDAIANIRAYQLLRGEKPGWAVLHPLILTHPVPRSQFQKRFGFDPIEGVRLATLAELEGPNGLLVLTREVDDIMRNINRRVSIPVVVFDPSVPSVKLLTKPSPTADIDSSRVGVAPVKKGP